MRNFGTEKYNNQYKRHNGQAKEQYGGNRKESGNWKTEQQILLS